MNARALVIGGNGFIGSHLVDRLVEEGWHTVVLDVQGRRYNDMPESVRFVQGDYRQPFILREALEGIDVVFHLAWTTIHETANRAPVDDIEANLIPSVRLLETCRHMEIGRIVFLSSGGTIYGEAKELPIPETHPQNPITAYGVTKLAVEKYLGMYRHLYGLESVILRPSNPYGPRQDPLRGQGAVTTFLYRVAKGLPITLWGDGQTTRDFFYVADLAEALLAGAMHTIGPEHIFNIGGGVEVTLSALLRLVEDVTGNATRICYEPERAFDAPRVFLDTNRARDSLQWQSQTSLRTGIALTWQWLQSALI